MATESIRHWDLPEASYLVARVIKLTNREEMPLGLAGLSVIPIATIYAVLASRGIVSSRLTVTEARWVFAYMVCVLLVALPFAVSVAKERDTIWQAIDMLPPELRLAGVLENFPTSNWNAAQLKSTYTRLKKVLKHALDKADPTAPILATEDVARNAENAIRTLFMFPFWNDDTIVLVNALASFLAETRSEYVLQALRRLNDLNARSSKHQAALDYIRNLTGS